MASGGDSTRILISAYDPNDDDDGANDESNLILVLNAILSGTARLNVLLPTATILAFAIFSPLLTNDAKCEPLNRVLMASFACLCATSCIFFTFTDSFRTTSGTLYYGVAMPRGIWTFNGGRKRPVEAWLYRLRWRDVFHAMLSLAAFTTFVWVNGDVAVCYYTKGPARKVIDSVPLVVGFVVSVLLVVFPTERRRVASSFLLQRDVLCYRT